MCRIFAHIAAAAQNASDYIVDSECSLLAQSTAKKNFRQSDGWGVAFLKNGGEAEGRRGGEKFEIFKSPCAIYKEIPLLKKIASQSVSKIVIAHIRAASNPLKLPKNELIAQEHSQPFGYKNIAFSHNGVINIAAQARDHLLGPFRKRLKGKNDSEIYFWILYKWIKKTGSVPDAFAKTAHELWRLWRELPAATRKKWKAPYSALNTAVSDGKQLYALCHSLMPPRTDSLCLGDQPYNRLAAKLEMEGKRLVVGSEKLDRAKGWKIFPMHHIMTAEQKNGRIHFEIRRFEKWR